MIGGNLNRQDINLLQKVMANPSLKSVDELLANMETHYPFSRADVSTQLKDPNSLLSKHLSSMIASFISAEEETRKETLRKAIANQEKKLKEEELLLEEKEQQGLARIIPESRINLELLKDDLQLLEKDINLDTNKARELNRALKIFGNNQHNLERARTSIEGRFEQIEANRRDILEASLDPSLSPEQRARREDLRESYARHIEHAESLTGRSITETEELNSPDTAIQTFYRKELNERYFAYMTVRTVDPASTLELTPRPTELSYSERVDRLSHGLNIALEKSLDKIEPARLLRLTETETLTDIFDLVSYSRQARTDLNTMKRIGLNVDRFLQSFAAKKEESFHEVVSFLRSWSAKYADEPTAAPSARPAWTQITPLVFKQSGGTRNINHKIAYETFKDIGIEETANGFKSGNDFNQVYYNSQSGEFFMNKFDQKMYEKIVLALSKTNTTIDISGVAQGNQFTAATTAKNFGLEVIGMLPDIEQKVEEHDRKASQNILKRS